jgi:hypothetical protein
MKNSGGSTPATLEPAAQQMQIGGYLYPSQGKLVVRELARVIRPPAPDQFEKLAVGCLGRSDHPG